jgi:hypothetical protein
MNEFFRLVSICNEGDIDQPVSVNDDIPFLRRRP